MQLQCRKVDNVEEESNRYFNDAREGKGFESGRMHDISRTHLSFYCLKEFQFQFLKIIHAHSNRESSPANGRMGVGRNGNLKYSDEPLINFQVR